MKVFVQLCSRQVNILVVWLVSLPPLLGFVPSSDESELLGSQSLSLLRPSSAATATLVCRGCIWRNRNDNKFYKEFNNVKINLMICTWFTMLCSHLPFAPFGKLVQSHQDQTSQILPQAMQSQRYLALSKKYLNLSWLGCFSFVSLGGSESVPPSLLTYLSPKIITL